MVLGMSRARCALVIAVLAAPAAADDITPLAPGGLIEREIRPGETHRYRIEVREGEYVQADIDQRGVEVTATVIDPGSRTLMAVSRPAAEYGPRPVAWLAAASGSHQVVLSVSDGFKLAGRYQLQTQGPRLPSAADLLRVKAVRVTDEADQLLHAAKPDAQKALELLKEARTDWDALGDSRMRMWLDYQIAFVLLQFFAQLDQSGQSFERAVETARDTADEFAEAHFLRNMAVNQIRQGRLDAARRGTERALALHRAGGRSLRVADTLLVLGGIALHTGDMQAALDHQHEALRMYEDLQDVAEQAEAHSNIGNSYFRLGEYELAIGQYRRALEGSDDDPSWEAYLIGQMGDVHFRQGDLRGARGSYEDALARFQRLGSRARIASVLARLAQVDRDEGRLEAAGGALEEAAAVFHEVGDPLAESAARCQLGETDRRRGDRDAAMTAFEAALALIPEGQAWQRLCVEEGLARLARDAGDLGGVRRHAERAIGIYESLRASVASPDSRSLTLASSQPLYELLIDARMRQHDAEPSAGHDVAGFEVSERARARSLLELLAQGRPGSQEAIEPALLAEQRALYRGLSPLWEAQEQALLGKGSEAADAIGRDIAALTTQLRAVEARMRPASPQHAQAQPLALADIRSQALDADTLLLEYALGEPASYLWVVSKDGLRSHRLAGRGEIESAARRVHETVAAIPVAGAGTRRRGGAWRSASEDLSRLILPPELSRGQATRLVVVAPGALQYVPFAVLPVRVAAGQEAIPLLAGLEVVNAPSASVLARLRQERGESTPATKTVAIFADPVFEPSDPRLRSAARARAPVSPSPAGAPAPLERALRGVRADALTRLPFSRQEAEAIAALVAPHGTALRALGFEANRATATSDGLAAYRIVHFATHGIVNTRQPELSGVVLSMLDRQGRKQDGFLRLHEIDDLHLGAELVVLSACQTGLGKDLRGEGFVGLTRAFMHAGAPRVVASLWQVDDLATAELMKRFYRAMLVRGLAPAAALRSAQRELAASRRWGAPYYWAGFVLHGEWR